MELPDILIGLFYLKRVFQNVIILIRYRHILEENLFQLAQIYGHHF